MDKSHSGRRPALAAASLVLLLGALGCGYIFRDAAILYMKVDAELSGRDIEIEIRKQFIEKYKDRVSISADLTIDKAMKKPNPGLFDGDFHFSGRAPEIGLPVVAEIANGASAPAATDLAHRFEAAGRPVRISGVWRIWAEHAKRAKEEQGKPLEPESSENPGHVFEIHPVTKIGAIRLQDTFRTIDGFTPGGARHTFGIYENVGCRITDKPRSVSLVTRKGIDNNVEFLMEIVETRQVEVEGGRFVIAAARDLQGDLLVGRLRMVFADDTPPETAVRHLKRGDRLRVYGLPRIDLAEIWRRVKVSRRDPSVLTKPLPYEIIIQGVFAND